MIIPLSHIKAGLELEIVGEDKTLFLISDEEVIEFAEAKIQLVEGCFYEYQFNDHSIRFKENCSNNKIIGFSKFGKYKGTISPNIYVGTHSLEIENSVTSLPIEVRSIKSDYRTEYRYMLEDITEKCTELIMQIDSPAKQHFETNFDTDNRTLYQRFSFVKSIIDSKEFEEAVQKIVSNPTTKWQELYEEKDIRSIRRFTQKNIKELITKSNRVALSDSHFLNTNYNLKSVPNQIENKRKIESIDTAENRFIKHVLGVFLFFCENCEAKFQNYSSAKNEAAILSSKISNVLNQTFFKDISIPTSLKLNSPVLQRKSGYREVLNAWLKFDLAAKLIWNGGDNVYDAGKKDVAALYEYWLFFTLLELLKDVFQIKPKSIEELIQFDKGKLSLNLKQGTTVALKGTFNSPSRKLTIEFSYNRSFGGGKPYPRGGSYTTTLRPDYTLSIWPAEIASQKIAEESELITHIHFDAKYKVNNFFQLISKSNEEELTDKENEDLIKDEEEEVKKGTFKNQDLLKMHAYKDAIRRTSGAYVLYPGEGEDKPFRGFHELIPGLGAFVIKPNKSVKDKVQLKAFINKVVNNFIDRASQHEKAAVKTYEVYKSPKADYLEDGITLNILNEPIPEYISGKKLIPDETFVLVGYATEKKRFDWYVEKGKYVFRMDDEIGSLELSDDVVNSKYLLIRKSGEKISSDMFSIISKGPKVFSKQQLVELDYPTSSGRELKDYYLVIDIEKTVDIEFQEKKWAFEKLKNYQIIQNSKANPRTKVGLPFTTTLTELMNVITK